MTLGIMQPYFLPNLGHFSLINQVNEWVVFDPVQFIRHGWIERNRILKPNEGWQYIGVPLVKHSRDTLIQDISIRNTEPWKSKIINQLQHYKKQAPHFKSVIALLETGFDFETDSITHLNTHLLQHFCKHLEIDFKPQIFSEMNLELNTIEHAGSWALEISKAMNASRYINPIGGKDLFDPEAFESAGIDLQFLNFEATEYHQKGKPFESNLSIVDVLMFNSVAETQKMLANFTLS